MRGGEGVVLSRIVALRTGVTGRADLCMRNGGITPWRQTEEARKEHGENQGKASGS